MGGFLTVAILILRSQSTILTAARIPLPETRSCTPRRCPMASPSPLAPPDLCFLSLMQRLLSGTL